MGKVNDDNSIQIYGWMTTKLKLKGNELLIYAIIYSFSQNNNNQGVFNGSMAYLQEWTNSSRQNTIECLNGLINKNLILKIKDNSLERKPSVYVTNFSYLASQESLQVHVNKVDKLSCTCQESLQEHVNKVDKTCQQSLHNNSTTTINISTTTIEEQLDYICKLYMSEITNRICCSSIEITALTKFIDMYGASAIENAIQIAVMRNKRSLGYIEGILKNEARVDNETDTTSTKSKEASMVRQRKSTRYKKIPSASTVETIEQVEAKFANETNDWD